MKPPKYSNAKAVPLPSAQTTVARCIGVIDIGTIPNEFKGEITIARKLYVTWELPMLKGVFNEDRGPEPFTIGLELTFSTNDKSNFSKLISAWRNKPLDANEKNHFDPMVMINKTAMISFIHARKSKYKGEDISEVTSENTVLKFNGIMQKPQEIVCPAMISKVTKWDWDAIADGTEKFEQQKFEKIPQWIREKMKTSEEFRKYANEFTEESEDPADNMTLPEDDSQGW